MASRARPLLVLALALLLAGCSPRPAPSIGVLAPLTGPLAEWGNDLLAGIQLAVDEQDAAHRPTLVIADTGGTARGATAAFEKVAGLGARVVIGPLTTDEALAAGLVARSRDVPCIVPAATGAGVVGSSPDYTMRLCYGDDEAAAALAAFAEEDLHLTRLALVVDLQSGYSLGLADAFAREFSKRRGLIVDSIYYHGHDPDGLAALDRVAALDVQGALLAGYAPDIVPMVGRASSPRLADLVLLGGDGWGASHLPEALAGKVRGAYHTRHFDPASAAPQVGAFVEAFRRVRGQAPSDVAALGYDAARVVLSVFDAGLDGAALRERLAALNGFPGVTGTLTLDPRGAALRLPIVIESFHEPAGPRVVATRPG